MHVFRNLSALPTTTRAVAIGNFDGVHPGHQAVLMEMHGAAQATQAQATVLTFEPHPKLFFAPKAPVFRLETLATKLHRLREANVEQVVMPRFDAAFASISAEAFLDDVLKTTLGAKAVVVGDNFAFGKQRRGDVAMLRAWGDANQIAITVVPPVAVAGAACSSSAIRAAIGVGDMEQARALLGRYYSFKGVVIHGDGRGKTIGFATANLALPSRLRLPALGVYAVRAQVGGQWYDAVANLGLRPTVSDTHQPSLEVHLFDVDMDMYGARMEVAFVQKLRDEKKFTGLDALVAQIADDCTQARIALAIRPSALL
jgi:riboflavin kinase/FMN adenylyltransferase